MRACVCEEGGEREKEGRGRGWSEEGWRGDGEPMSCVSFTWELRWLKLCLTRFARPLANSQTSNTKSTVDSALSVGWSPDIDSVVGMSSSQTRLVTPSIAAAFLFPCSYGVCMLAPERIVRDELAAFMGDKHYGLTQGLEPWYASHAPSRMLPPWRPALAGSRGALLAVSTSACTAKLTALQNKL